MEENLILLFVSANQFSHFLAYELCSLYAGVCAVGGIVSLYSLFRTLDRANLVKAYHLYAHALAALFYYVADLLYALLRSLHALQRREQYDACVGEVIAQYLTVVAY